MIGDEGADVCHCCDEQARYDRSCHVSTWSSGQVALVDLPKPDERLEILRTITKKTPLSDAVDLQAIAYDSKLEGFSGADLARLSAKQPYWLFARRSSSTTPSLHHRRKSRCKRRRRPGKGEETKRSKSSSCSRTLLPHCPRSSLPCRLSSDASICRCDKSCKVRYRSTVGLVRAARQTSTFRTGEWWRRWRASAAA